MEMQRTCARRTRQGRRSTRSAAATISSFESFSFCFWKKKIQNIKFANPLRQIHIFRCVSNKLKRNQWAASFRHQTCLGRNDTSKQVIVWSLGGLSRGLLRRRVHDPSQNPRLDCNQEPLAVCRTLSHLFSSLRPSPRDAEFFRT